MDRKPHQERTLVILKPDTIQRSLMGEVIRRFERTGLKFTAMKMVRAEESKLLTHYNKNEEWFQRKGNRIIEDLKEHGLPIEKDAMTYGKAIIDTIVHYMTAAPVLIMILEGNEAVKVVTKLVGTTEPSTSDVGTIRGDYTVDSYGHSSYENRAVRNLIHCSESPVEAEREIKVWFTDDEVMNYVTAQERIMYDVDFDGQNE
jgi:nucleoside-diphosphate kinase